MEIRLAKDIDRIQWEQFITENSDSSLFHLFDWKKIFERNYGLKTFYLMAKENGSLRGILPLVFFKSHITGKFFVSFPISDDGGICAQDEEVYNLLIQEAIKIAKRENVEYIEFHHSEKFKGLITKLSKVTAWLQLRPDPQKLWLGFKDKVRNQIRKAQKSGLDLKIGGIEDVDGFYEVFAVNMRDAGIPAHSREFFIDILKTFPERTKIFSVLKDDKTIASGFTIGFKDRLEIPWAGSLKKYNKFCPNHLLYWEILQYACKSGYRIFSFGRSTKDSGTYIFKKQWGTEFKQLYWQYCLTNGKPLPETNPENPNYALAMKLWKKMPVAITKKIGPKIMRMLPY